MATDLIVIEPDQPSAEALERAAAAIRRGAVVAIPTDGLYSLVADPFNLRAVGQVFLAKGREPHRSLPLLIPGMIPLPPSSAMSSEDSAKNAARLWRLLLRGDGRLG